jgi:hypothetical protein
MGLLVLSYAGSFLVGKSAVRGGLPAGTEYVVLGFVLGPSALGLVERSLLEAFEPAAHAALGWLALVLGLQYGVNGGRRVRALRMFGSQFAFLFTAACIAAAVYGVLVLVGLPRFPQVIAGKVPLSEKLLIAGGVGAATAETTRFAVRWIVERHHASGPVTDLVGDLAEADDLVPLLAMAALFAWSPEKGLVLAHQPWWTWIVLTLGLGALLGAMAAVLLGSTFRIAEAWSVMLGMAMLTIGTASRLGLASMAAMFVMGAAISALSRHRDDIVAMIAPTERPVMLPALLLAGASIDFGTARWLPLVLVAALLARVVAKLFVGFGLLALVKKARPAGARLGFGLCSAGALSMSIGLTFALRFRGTVGNTVLVAAAIATLAGELIGAPALRSCLRRGGELPDPTMEPAPSTEPSPTVDPQASGAPEAGDDAAASAEAPAS